MGCFDYECACGGKTCVFVGGQNGGNSTVVVEVPLLDGTFVFLKGKYNSYGTVDIGEYKFYAEQFRDFFPSWLDGLKEDELSKCFKARDIWTLKYTKYVDEDDDEYDPDNMANNAKVVTSECFDDGDVSNMTSEIIEKCIRVKKKEPLRRKLRR